MTLRIVRPDETPPAPPVPVEVAPAPVPARRRAAPVAPTPSPECGSFQRSIAAADTASPVVAGRVVVAGLQLLETALELHQAVADKAAPGTYRCDVTPGRKGAEATRACKILYADEVRGDAEIVPNAIRVLARAHTAQATIEISTAVAFATLSTAVVSVEMSTTDQVPVPETTHITVDRGNPVILDVTFDGRPDGVFFSHQRPGSARPYADDGFGSPRSRILQLAQDTYRFIIDTTGFASGEDGAWCFSAEWDEPHSTGGYRKAAIRGTYGVKPAPTQVV